ncbi:MAG: FHA domain-containing protein [Candidatus Schekmanbacteria bacterium]|nr:FHA domain-containing protein [Candidatus Schekmanbacteria bacterium]
MNEAELERTQVYEKRRMGPSTRVTMFLPSGDKEELELDKDEVIIGRSKECDIVVPDASVSRNHIRLSYEGGTYLLKDLGSTNGIRVNGELTRKCYLKDEDTIQVGRVFLKFAIAGKRKAPGAEDSQRVQVVARKTGWRDRLAARLGRRAGPAASTGGRRRLYLIAAIAMVLMVVVLGSSGKRKQRDPQPTPVASAAVAAPEIAPATATAIPATPAAGEPLLAEQTERLRIQKRLEVSARAARESLEGLEKLFAQARTASELDHARTRAADARKAFDEALQLDPKNAEASKGRGRVVEIEKRIAAKLKDMEAAQDKETAALSAKAQALFNAGNYSGAITAWQSVLERSPGSPQASAGIANARQALAKRQSVTSMEAAATALLAAIREAIEKGGKAANDGLPATALNHYDVARAKIEEVSGLGLPNSSNVLIEVKSAEREIQERTRPLLQEVERIKVAAREAFGLGVTYQSLNQLAEARRQWEKVLEISKDPGDEYHRKAKAKLAELGGGGS